MSNEKPKTISSISDSNSSSIFYPIISIIGLIFLWWAVVEAFDIPEYVLPGPFATFHEIILDWPELWHGFTSTGQEFVYGFIIGSLVGFVLAVIMANSKLLNKILYPIMIVSQAIPVIAIGAALVIWLGFGLAPKLVIIALIVFFPVLINVLDGLQSVDVDMLNLSKAMGANRWRIFLTVQLPATYVPLFSALKMSATFSVTGAVLAEQTASSQAGLGQYMMAQASRLNTKGTFAAIILFAIMGLLAFSLVSVWERLATPWKQHSKVPFYRQARIAHRDIPSSQVK
ncbi:MAG: ABC transporter permease [Bifidobacterium aquikefiri]|uniref:ABC transporter permease n=1 Tax=Bifidobacterium aquikefiri TaxID=1653207 RepID=A0A261G662_9BIFI|nr:ABC transporter permease [Bifidobacterium aquikefiri]OZG66902.1 ABC transporter permease [Bifidobacterium aquikefiri]